MKNLDLDFFGATLCNYNKYINDTASITCFEATKYNNNKV